MFFHIIGIKEIQKKRYNIDILIKGDTESAVKDFLHNYNIIVLNFSLYKDDFKKFGNIDIQVNHKNDIIDIISASTDIEQTLFEMFLIGFPIKHIDYLDKNLNKEIVKDIINQAQNKALEFKNQKNKQEKEKKDKEKSIYRDEKLSKVLSIVERSFGEIQNLLDRVGDNVSQDKIRDLNVMKDQLTKLKMSKNDDKMLELLKNIYNKSDEIYTEYLDNTSDSKSYITKGSIVSDFDVMLEIEKLQKAKKIKEIGAKRDIDDNYYLSFEFIGLYFRFLNKDIRYKFKNIKGFFGKSYDFLETVSIMLLSIIAILLWFKKIGYFLNPNDIYYLIMIKISSFALVIFFFKKFQFKTQYGNIALFFVAVLVSVLLFLLIKFNFAI